MNYDPTLVAEVKTILGYRDGTHDDYLSTMIPILIEHVSAHCHNDFVAQSTGLVVIPGGVRLFIAKACEHNMNKAGLKSRSMGSVSYSYDLEFPSSLMAYIRPYRRLKFHATR